MDKPLKSSGIANEISEQKLKALARLLYLAVSDNLIITNKPLFEKVYDIAERIHKGGRVLLYEFFEDPF